MSAALILVRHGNTFESHERAVWVGARTDMKLTAEGEAQANAVASYIAQHYTDIGALTAGPLLRTRRTAEIIGAKTNAVVLIDDRLREIDYGTWEGRDNTEIAAQDAEALAGWQDHGVWPENAGWQPSFADLCSALANFLDEQKQALEQTGKSHIAVTSNGILRIIHALISNDAAGNAVKVKTGHLCVIVPDGAGWKISAWNLIPTQR